jgi:hypothetical protein
MRPILIVSGVLGGGSALVFALAALVATLFPTGTLVAANPWNGGVFMKGGVAVPMPAPPVMVNGGNVPWVAPDGTVVQPVQRDVVVGPNVAPDAGVGGG